MIVHLCSFLVAASSCLLPSSRASADNGLKLKIKLPLSHKISHMTVGLLLSITWHDPNRNLCLYLNYQYKVYILSLSPLLLLSKWQYCYCCTWVRVSRICFALYCNYNFIEIDLDGMQCSTPINQKILSSKSAFWYIFIIICPSVNRHFTKRCSFMNDCPFSRMLYTHSMNTCSPSK